MDKKPTFKRIALLGRQKQVSIANTLATLASYLTKQSYTVVFEEETAKELSESQYPIIPCNELNQACDLIIVVGGDGSLLHAARIAVDQNLPVLGINRGLLGFLTDICPDEFNKLDNVLSGEYHEEERFLLTMQLKNHDKILAQNDALNDVVFMSGDVAHLIEFEITIDQEFVCSQRGDGLIIATPTGSTAYALSGGGPILHPQLDAIVIVPMFPHTLTSRPIVVKGSSKIEIIFTKSDLTTSYVSCDGQKSLLVEHEQVVQVCKKPSCLRLIHPIDYHYFETLRAKLNWYSKK